MDKHVESARSEFDGIVFYSNTVPFLGVRSIVTVDGRYIARPTWLSLEDFFGFISGNGLRKYVLDRKSILMMNILLLLLAVTTMDPWIIFGMVYFVVFASKYFYQLVTFSAAIKFGDARSVGRFHSAEHKVVNAYNTLKRIPTMEELTSFSRFSNECGSRKLIKHSLIYTLISIEIMVLGRMDGYAYLIGLVITSILIALISRFNWDCYFQVLVTNKPTAVELQVAYNGIIAFDNMESDVESECLDRMDIDFSQAFRNM